MLFRIKSTYSPVRDNPVKSMVKAITWRIVGTFDTMVLSYIITGKMIIAISIGSFEVFSKMILYFLHERFWAIVRWSRIMVIIRRNTRNTKKRLNEFFLIYEVSKKNYLYRSIK
jgi:uncharacterized membrane protein